MKLKKFKQFLQEINEELTEDEFRQGREAEYDDVDDFKKELGSDELAEEDFSDEDDEFDATNNPDEFDETDVVSEEETEEEEEGHEYKGNLLMQELADKLGTEVVDNQIDYNGKTINYYSETEKFHIGRDKFDTIEEVLDFLGSGSEMPEEAPEDLSAEEATEEVERGELEEIGESRRYIKRFN